MGCHFLLQGIFPTQGLNLGLQYCRQILYHLSHQGIYLQCRRLQFDPWVGEIPWRREWLPTPVFLPGDSIDREEAWRAAVHGITRVGHDRVTNTSLLISATRETHKFSSLCITSYFCFSKKGLLLCGFPCLLSSRG